MTGRGGGYSRGRYAAFLFGGGLLSAALWRLADLLKPRLLGDVYAGMAAWVRPYFHPYEGGLLNYLFLAAGLAVPALLAYWLAPALESTSPAEVPSAGGRLRAAAAAAGVALLLFLSVEPLRLMLGPVQLMNEYPELFSSTLLDGKETDNGAFLSSKKRDAAVLLSFQEANHLEYLHQVMGRGQLNHIGHVLNPVSEYALGRPLKDLYIQYGLGNMLLFKFTMEAFGGISIQNYYKCYLYYILYYAVFLAVLFYLFRDPRYVLCAFSAVALTHFSYSYVGFLLAPGIIPTIHFFDAAALLAVAAYLRRSGRNLALAVSAVLIVWALFFNRQFGGMLAIAWAATLAVYGAENRGRTGAVLFFVGPLAVIAGSLLVFGGGGAGDGGIFRAYFSGYFSWAPPQWAVLFTVAYLLLSYLFLLKIKADRSPEKYLFIFSFVYAQGLFVYFYWSGLTNHLPGVCPFLTLQILFAAVIVERNGYGRLFLTPAAIERVKIAGAAGALFLAAYGAKYFYRSAFGVAAFRDNFASHRAYTWTFERASLVSTMPPSALEEAVALVRKYSDGPAITLVSKYDNLLPFLSRRYNLLPHFEMPWYLISGSKYNEALRRLEELRSEYLFADTDFEQPHSDPWAGVYPDPFVVSEQAVRAGRIESVRALFLSVRSKYRLVEAGRIISVYRRVPGK